MVQASRLPEQPRRLHHKTAELILDEFLASLRGRRNGRGRVRRFRRCRAECVVQSGPIGAPGLGVLGGIVEPGIRLAFLLKVLDETGAASEHSRKKNSRKSRFTYRSKRTGKRLGIS